MPARGYHRSVFERLKRLIKSVSDGIAGSPDPDSFDPSRPHRVNAPPPERDWYARTRERSLRARAAAAAKDDKALDDHYAELSPEASQHVDEVLANMGKKIAPPPRG